MYSGPFFASGVGEQRLVDFAAIIDRDMEDDNLLECDFIVISLEYASTLSRDSC